MTGKHERDENLARLQRIQEARRAGIDVDRDLCTHGYINGHGCDDCDRFSRRVEFVVFGLALAILVAIVGTLGYHAGWYEAIWKLVNG